MPKPSVKRSPPRIVLIDGANALYRAFFAIPGLRAPDGSPTNAAYGFVQMLRKVLREEDPDYVAVVFDPRGKTFRHELYPEYKATRDAQPEDLSSQFPVVKELCDAYQLAVIEVAGFEADDVIATLARGAPRGAHVSIVSTDKDLLQLVNDQVTLVDGMKDRRFEPDDVEEKFGVPAGQVLDLRALVGDPSDNIPGVKGIGEKGAAKLIREWGTLENLLAHAGDVSAKRAREALESQAEAARLSKELATLRSDVPLDRDLEDLRRRAPDAARLRPLFERLGFKRLIEELDGEDDGAGGGAPDAPDTRIVRDVDALRALVRDLGRAESSALLVVLGEGGPMSGEPVGIAFGLPGGDPVYVPVGRRDLTAPAGLPLDEVVEIMRPAFDPDAPGTWVGRDTKSTQVLLAEHGLPLPVPAFDAELAAGLLDSTGGSRLPGLAERLIGARLRSWEDLVGRGARARRAADVPDEEVAGWCGEQVSTLGALVPPLRKQLESDELDRLYEDVELPLTAVLARMERTGVRVDEDALRRLSGEYQKQLDILEGEIHTLAGERFLVSSPRQLQGILFEKLKLPVIKKTKTGYSTDEDVLEQLSAHHELPARVLAHRRLAKLKNTYVDALPPLVNPRTGRIHPTFHQLGAATGRLSATNPNVQNIPIRTEEGVRIREAFVPAEGRVLLSADYSQVELRILAHYSGDESLIEAFEGGEDIHRRTAAEVQGVAVEDVTAEQRARAKAVNFGIIYGSSAFGLARQLGIASAEAQATIDAYFARYRGVRRFLDETIASARERGYVKTYLGRRRPLPDLRSRNRALRSAAERMAVNTVIQGTAADLIKSAMVAVDRDLARRGLSAQMILQVHDELVFEVPKAEVDALSGLLRERMEGVLDLSVPLVIDLGVGANWREAH